jgi:putative endopeptidase
MRRTKTDVHSLGKWRVNAALKNIEDFYTAFDIKEGDAMYLAPEERINIW